MRGPSLRVSVPRCCGKGGRGKSSVAMSARGPSTASVHGLRGFHPFPQRALSGETEGKGDTLAVASRVGPPVCCGKGGRGKSSVSMSARVPLHGFRPRLPWFLSLPQRALSRETDGKGEALAVASRVGPPVLREECSCSGRVGKISRFHPFCVAGGPSDNDMSCVPSCFLSSPIKRVGGRGGGLGEGEPPCALASDRMAARRAVPVRRRRSLTGIDSRARGFPLPQSDRTGPCRAGLDRPCRAMPAASARSFAAWRRARTSSYRMSRAMRVCTRRWRGIVLVCWWRIVVSARRCWW